jgi:hypothetical protein
MSPRYLLSALLASALQAPVEASIREILVEYGSSPDSDLLQGLAELKLVLETHNLEVVPHLGTGGIEDSRVFRRAASYDISRIALDAIKAGEGKNQEFKSTLFFDVNRWRMNPPASLSECRSVSVSHSVCKTIAAFLNTEGGTLYIGIDDSGGIFGLEEDMMVANPAKSDFDGWELALRNLVRSEFCDNSVDSYMAIQSVSVEKKIFARVQVAQRKTLSFIQPNDKCQLYIRSGNTSIPIKFNDIGKYFEMKKLFS